MPSATETRVILMWLEKLAVLVQTQVSSYPYIALYWKYMLRHLTLPCK